MRIRRPGGLEPRQVPVPEPNSTAQSGAQSEREARRQKENTAGVTRIGNV